MFNIGATELLLILAIAFLVVGPKDLPKVGRALGKLVRYIRNLMDEVKREAGLDEVEEAMKEASKAVSSTDPTGIKGTMRDVESTLKDVEKELNEAQK